jgi:peroxiredoxin Q/BCP
MKEHLMRINFFTPVVAIAASLLALSQRQPALANPEIKVGQNAPLFELPQDDGSVFKLASRKGQGWSVLYFYPKAETPGCTKQACAFRDSIKLIRAEGAEVYGMSTDSVEKLAAFRKNHNLNFPLLSDEKAKVVELYGAKMPVVGMAKRWTFLVDSDLVIRWIDNNVDPAKDAQNVAQKIKELKK